jgi:hypothetical protein
MGNVQSVDADSLFAGEGEHTTRDFCRKLAARLRYKWTTSLDEWCDDVAVDTHTIPVPKAIAKVKRMLTEIQKKRSEELSEKATHAKLGEKIFENALKKSGGLTALPPEWRNAIVPKHSDEGRVSTGTCVLLFVPVLRRVLVVLIACEACQELLLSLSG